MTRRRDPRADATSGWLGDHPLAVGLTVIAIAAVAIFVSITAIDGLPFSSPYRVDAVVSDDGPIVRPGDEVRIAGRRVGEVREVEAEGVSRRISMELSEGEVSADARAVLRLRGLAGAVFVQLDPGAGEAAPSGSTIPRSHTSSGVPLTDVIEGFDDRTRADLRRALTGYGAGVAGRGEGLNRGLADLPETLEDATPLLRALDPSPGTLSELVGDAGTVAEAAGADRPALADLITGARQTFEAPAAERASLEAALEAAPAAQDELALTTPEALPLLADLERAGGDLAPAAQELEQALPAVNSLLARDGELDAFNRILDKAPPVLELAGSVIPRLEPSALTLTPLVDAAHRLAVYVSRYPDEIFAGPHGFTTWGRFGYDEGQAPGAKAVRFTMVFTCAPGRNPYPAPGEAATDRKPCRE